MKTATAQGLLGFPVSSATSIMRDPAELTDEERYGKAYVNHYRRATNPDKSCCFCVVKSAVPYMWCPEVGRPAEPHMTCDKQKS